MFLLTLIADSVADGKCGGLVTVEPIPLADGDAAAWGATARLVIEYDDDTGEALFGTVELADGGSVSWAF